MFRTTTQAKPSWGRDAEQTASVARGHVARLTDAYPGNQSALRTLGRTARIQPKLTVGATNDPLETEADRVAEQVMRMPDSAANVSGDSGTLRRKCDACEEDDKKLNAKSDGSPARTEAPPIVHSVLRSPGQRLEGRTVASLGPRFGHDFSGVRVHTGPEAAQSAAAVGALAYTVGDSVVFGQGRYAPQTTAGQRLLAHELAHVVQQRSAASAKVMRAPDPAPAASATPATSATPGSPQLTLSGHTPDGDGQIVDQLLQAKLTVGPDGQPVYFGVPSTVQEIVKLLASAAPSIPQFELQGRVNFALRQKSTGTSVAPGAGLTPQLTLGGHTLDGDRKAVDQLLQSQLTVGQFAQPVYLGVASSLPLIVALLRTVAPTLPEAELKGHVSAAWGEKIAGARQLPPLFPGLFQLPTGPVGPLAPGPQDSLFKDAPSPTETPSDPGSGSMGAKTPWQPSVGPQVTINIARGTAPLVAGSMQRQYTLGDNLQVVFTDSKDVTAGTYQALAGGQGLGASIFDSKIIQLQPFVQLLAGLSQMPGTFSASMTIQITSGAQLTLKFGPVTIQVTAGFQTTAVSGQGATTAAAFSIGAGPTTPDASGTQSFGGNKNWWIGVGPPPAVPGAPGSQPIVPAGGLLNFGGTF